MFTEKLALEILDYPKGITSIEQVDNEIFILSKTRLHDDVYNIYELANLCKIWAYKKGVNSFLSGIDTANKEPTFFVYLADFKDSGGYDKQFKADNEPEAVFKACEWIFNKKGIV